MIKYLFVLLLSSVKFAFTFPLAVLEYHFSFWETVVLCNIGAIAGIIFFSQLSKYMVDFYKFMKRRYLSNISIINFPERKYNTKKKRRLIRFKKSYGFWGIVLLTPLFISTPIGTFLIVRYFKSQKYALLTLFVSHVVWSIAYASIFSFADQSIFS